MTAIIAPLIRKLESFTPLTEDEKRGLTEAVSAVRRFPPREDLVREGEQVAGVKLILEGLACRYKVLPDGRRQIIAYLVPGDLCDVRVFFLRRMDHAIAALCPVETAVIAHEPIQELMDRHPRLTRALWWSTLVEESVTREWIVNVGQRTAFERLAHLFCEIFARLQAVGLAHDNRCELPLTQIELADTLALSAVHVNRTLMEMRRARLVTFQNRQLVIHDFAALQATAGFNPSYLHLDGEAAAPRNGAQRADTGVSGL
jgi:CRP-like cAMP-binding protein